MKILGLDELKKKLARLEKRGAKTALRKATRAGTTVLGKAVRQAVPIGEGEDAGALKKMTTTSVTGRGLSMTGKAGADVAKLKSDVKRPSNIDHLVEYGHVAPNGTLIPPAGYMRNAAANAMPAAEAAYRNKLAAEIEREASK